MNTSRPTKTVDNPYDPGLQPTLHKAYASSKEQIVLDEVETLLDTIQRLDRLVGELQAQFIADVCLTYNGKYIYARGSILFVLQRAVRRAAIRLEQVPEDLQEDLAAILRESEEMWR